MTTTNATLNIQVNARQVSGLNTQLKQVFSKTTVAPFNAALGVVNQQLTTTKTNLQHLIGQLANVKQGTQAFKDLSKQINQTNSAIRTLSASARSLASTAPGSQPRLPITPNFSGGFGGVGRAAGAAQAAIAGAGALSQRSQIGIPGMAGLGLALGAIPLVGGAAAGALNASTAAYGSYIENQRANMAASPFLMGSRSMMGFRASTLPGRGAWMPPGIGGRTNDLYGDLSNQYLRGRGSDSDKALLGAMAAAGSMLDNLFGTDLRTKRTTTVRYKDGSFGGTPHPIFGTGEGGGSAGTMGSFDRSSYNAAGLRFGMNATSSIEAASALSRSAGRPVGAGEFAASLAATTLFGVSGESQGAFMYGASRTGNGGGMQNVADLIGLAVAGHLEASDIGKMLEEQASWLESMFRAGSDVSLGGMRVGTANLAASGVDMLRASRMATSFGGGVANMARAGAQDGADVRMMRTFGFTGKGGFEEYAKVMLDMQDPGAAAERMAPYLQSFMSPRLGVNAQARVLQQAAGKFGAMGSAADWRRIAASGLQTGVLSTTDLSAMLETGMGAARSMGGDLIGQAGIDNETITAGGKTAGVVQALQRSMLDIVSAFDSTLGPSIHRFAGTIESATELIDRSLGNSYGESRRE